MRWLVVSGVIERNKTGSFSVKEASGKIYIRRLMTEYLCLHERSVMTPKQKILILSAGGLIVIGLSVYGGMSLFSKMNQVKELNTQIAEADQTDKQEGEAAATPPPTEEATQQEPTPTPTDDEPGREENPVASQDASGVATPSGSMSSANPDPTATPKPAGEQEAVHTKPPVQDDSAKRKQEIDASTTVKMENLRVSCSATSSSLVEQIKAEIEGNEDTAIDTIQEKFLTKVIEAEADCDAKFVQLVEEAKVQYSAEGIDEQSLPDWSAEYESAKTEARSAALVEIANAMSS